MTKLILGPPGTGKTTFLIDTIKTLTHPLIETAFVSFTKAAIEEAKERTAKAFPEADPKIDLINFRTLHSFCHNLMQVRRGQIITQEQMREFEEQMGMDYEIDVEVFDVSKGVNNRNIPLYLHHLSINLCQPIDEVHQKYGDQVTLAETNFVIESYEAFKKARKVIDFNDMLLWCSKYAAKVECKTVFLDEAQDLTTLQWLVFDRIFGKCQTIYYAGDDDQAIYVWAGVNVKDFLTVKHDEKKILTQSYRIPKEVHNLSERMAKRIKDRYDKSFLPASHKGYVSEIYAIEDLQRYIIETMKKKESWFLLVRNTFFANKFFPFLYEAGIPFKYFKTNALKKEDILAIGDYEQLKRGNMKEAPEVLGLVKSFVSNLDYKDPWYIAFDKMDSERKLYYRTVKNNGFKLTETPRFEISTIHQVKGREADNIILVPDMTSRSFDNVESDDEHRVFYVAITRAKKNLFILEPTSPKSYDVQE